MKSTGDSSVHFHTKQLLTGWTGLVLRFRGTVLTVFLLLTCIIFYYITGHLGIITDTAGMLSPDLKYLRTYREYKKAFPQSTETIVVVIDGVTPDIAIDARDRLARALQADSARFRSVYAPGSETFFKENGLLYLSETELEKLVNRLAEIQPLLGTLVREPDLRGLFYILKEAKSHNMDQELGPLYEEMDRAVNAVADGRFYQVSWLKLMDTGNSASVSNTRQFVVTKPVMDYTTILPGKSAMQTIRDTASRLEIDADHGIKLRLTGDIAMEYEELVSVTRGAKLAGWLSLFMVTIVLFTGLRSTRMVFVTLITLVTGLIWTAGFAAAAIGHLNMISVAFAVLFIGLGVDYSIHYCLRFRELLSSGVDVPDAMARTASDTGSSLVLCAITTSIGFFAFVPTDFSGVGELGLISGTGMFIGLFMNLTLLPALLSMMKFRPAERPAGPVPMPTPTRFAKLVSFPVRHARAVRISAILLGLGSLVLLPRITYDWNPLNLRDQSCESVATFKELLSDITHSPWTLKLLEKPSDQLEKKLAAIRKLPVVDKVVTINDFVPDNQEEKLLVIDEMNFTIGPIFMETPASPPTDAERLSAIEAFLHVAGRHIPSSENATSITAENFVNDLAQLMGNIRNAQGSPASSDLLNRLEQSMLASLPPRLNDLRLSLQARAFSMQDLPLEIKSRWVAADGRWRVEIFPAGNLNSRDEMIKFITAIRTYEPDLTGYPVLIYEGGKVVSGAFKQAFAMSLTAIALLLFFLMPHRKDALLVMIPLALAGMLTGAVMELAGISLNFANIIALPLILGIGVDNGIHLVHRFRTMKVKPAEIFSTSTSRGIIFSTLTTICSFGNLAVSPHEGMASMGKLLAAGVGLTLICTMVLLPAIMTVTRHE